MTLTILTTTDTITTNQPSATLPCGLIPQPTCRAKSETPHIAGGWEFAERRMVTDMVGDLSRHYAQPR
jgi:hypothetical protein